MANKIINFIKQCFVTDYIISAKCKPNDYKNIYICSKYGYGGVVILHEGNWKYESDLQIVFHPWWKELDRLKNYFEYHKKMVWEIKPSREEAMSNV